jgi:hypothetical protein
MYRAVPARVWASGETSIPTLSAGIAGQSRKPFVKWSLGKRVADRLPRILPM